MVKVNITQSQRLQISAELNEVSF